MTEEEFQKWLDVTPKEKRTNKDFKNHFGISDDKENQLKKAEIEKAKQKFKDNPKALLILSNLK